MKDQCRYARFIAATCILAMTVCGIRTAAVAATQAAETVSAFGTCRWWSNQKRTMESRPVQLRAALEMYRVGYAQGFAAGTGASPVAYFFPITASDAPALQPLIEFGVRGFERLLERPSILVDAFDQSCSDYRNDAFLMEDVGVVAILEIGGLPESRAAEAYRSLRLAGPVDVKRLRVFEALSGKAAAGNR